MNSSVFIGHGAGARQTNQSNNVAIGAGADTTESNSTVVKSGPYTNIASGDIIEASMLKKWVVVHTVDAKAIGTFDSKSEAMVYATKVKRATINIDIAVIKVHTILTTPIEYRRIK
jgi:hypothetical protein